MRIRFLASVGLAALLAAALSCGGNESKKEILIGEYGSLTGGIATFGISTRVETVALPSLVDLGEFRELRRAEFLQSDQWLDKSIGRGISCIYNLLWSIAQPVDVLRSSDLMYDFDRLVTSRLAGKLTVSSIAYVPSGPTQSTSGSSTASCASNAQWQTHWFSSWKATVPP